MNSKSKWLGLLLVVTLLLTGLASTVMAAPAAVVDNDQDGLTIDTLNPANNTDPNDFNWDTDGDGLCDGDGTGPGCLNPVGEDLDQDGVLDPDETDNTKADTDGDGVPDGWERVFSSTGPGTVPAWLAAKYNPLLVGKTAGCGVTNPRDAGDALLDKDVVGGQDGLTNLQEFQGVAPYQPTDPCLKDTDGDGVSDGDEALGVVNGYKSDPNDVDSDDDGLNDAAEGANLTDPENPDTDGDGMDDYYEVVNACLDPLVNDAAKDSDKDTLSNIDEMNLGLNPCLKDTDDDGMDDGDEVKYSCLDPLEPDDDLDFDFDKLFNIDELDADTDPCNADTDGDGMDDYFEVVSWGMCGEDPGLDPLVDDAMGDLDADGAWNLLEYQGIDLEGPWTIDAGIASVNVADVYASTSPCNEDTDSDSFTDGYEYWARLREPTPATPQNACTGWVMEPSVTNEDGAGNPDGDMDYKKAWDYLNSDALNNWEEFNGPDGVAPVWPYTQLIDLNSPYFMPGDDATSACLADTDQGGVEDGHEKALELDANDAADDNNDRDLDGLTDAFEDDQIPNGVYNPKIGYSAPLADGADYGETNFDDADTDNDGLCDGGIAVPGVCVAGEDKNGDGKLQKKGADGDAATLADNETDPKDWDSDDDGLRDGWEAGLVCLNPNVADDNDDPDGDGIKTGWENAGPDLQNYASVAGSDGVYDKAAVPVAADDEYLDPCVKDSDGGGAWDGWEWVDSNADGIPDVKFLDPKDPADDKSDRDLDGILDVTEDANHNGLADDATGYNDPDTDRDGLCDGKIAADGVYKDIVLADPYLPGWPSGKALDIAIVSGEMYLDLNDNGFYYPTDPADKFICSGGENLDAAGVWPGDPALGIDGDENGDGVWNWTPGADLFPGNADDVFEQWKETDATDPDTDKDGLCDGPKANAVAGASTCVGHEVVTDALDADSDNDFLSDYFEAITKTCLDPNDDDTDNDGLVDGRQTEIVYDQQLNKLAKTPANGWGVFYGIDGKDGIFGTGDEQFGEDLDGDGVYDADETDPCDADSDDDGVMDGIEWKYYEYVDRDASGTFTFAGDTNIDADGDRPARDADSDGDNLCDGDVTNAANAGCAELSKLIGEDVDGDGVWDKAAPDQETNPMDRDSDGDKVRDGVEVRWYETFDCAAWAYTAPLSVSAGTWDCDADGVRNALDTDSDEDGLTDGGEDANRDGSIGGDTDKDRIWDDGEQFTETDPLNPDTDGDGLTDGVEDALDCGNALNPVGDCDEDGLTDADEVLKYGTDPTDEDSDDDGWNDGEEVLGKVIPSPYPGGVGGEGSYQTCDPLNPDSDNDGLDDWEEGNLDGGVQNDGWITDCRKGDTDDGGLSDHDEWWATANNNAGLAWNPQNGLDDIRDTDGDGLSDAAELMHPVYGACLNPLSADSDGDLLSDSQEVDTYGTNPCDEDTDNDLIGDGDEVVFTNTDPTKPDTDGDGLPDGEEVFLYKTDPNKMDTDGDGLDDGDEVKVYMTDPNRKDTDGDGMGDLYEVSHACLKPTVRDGGLDADGDGLTNLQESKLDTDPCNGDTDGDGMMDGYEAANSCLDPKVADAGEDPDGDDLTNAEELAAGTDPCVDDTDGDGLKDMVDPWPLSSDGDGDGMPDAYEVLHPCLDPKVDDADENADGDDYTNIQEYQKGTDPCVFNCDIAYDWDQDNEVTVNDVLMMVGSWGATPASPNWVAAYDVDGDGVITVIDFMIVVNAIGTTCILP